MNIYVGSLSYEVTEEDLQEAFANYGEVVSVKVIKDHTVKNYHYNNIKPLMKG